MPGQRHSVTFERQASHAPPDVAPPAPPSPVASDASDGWLSSGSEGDQHDDQPLSALLPFVGPKSHLEDALHGVGFTTEAYDICRHPEHDITDPAVYESLIQRAGKRTWNVLIGGSPCASFSFNREGPDVPQLRSRRQPLGIDRHLIPRRWHAYLDKHNKLIEIWLRLLRAALAEGTEVIIEFSADLGDVSNARYGTARFAEHGSFWQLDAVSQLKADFGLVLISAPFCFWGSPFRKWFSLLCSPRIAKEIRWFEQLACTHSKHACAARGFDSEGRSLSRRSGEYGPEWCRDIAHAVSRAVNRSPTPQLTLPTRLTVGSSGGRAADGASLCAAQRLAIESARVLPVSFGSPRNLQPAPRAELLARPFPTIESIISTPAPSDRPAPRHPGRPSGDVSVAMLVGEGSPGDGRPSNWQRLQQWQRRAEAKMNQLFGGPAAPDPGSLVIKECDRPKWTWGIDFDCADPDRCVELKPSDIDTVFPGPKQIDRHTWRAMAREVGCRHQDLYEQMAGGIEMRPDCPRDIVLFFHHPGFVANFACAVPVIDNEIAQQWASSPVAWLPFVPFRCLPRDVIMQPRTRVLADGSTEEYLKPRLTHDPSKDHPDSPAPNSGVPQSRRTIELPSVQTDATAAAIVTEIGAPEVQAGAGAVDASNAYSYLPIQRLERPFFGFFYAAPPTADGQRRRGGFSYALRMIFGGASSPQSWQSVYEVPMELARRRMSEFDAANPYPPAVQQRIDARAALQRAGRLPPGDRQLRPEHLGHFIDDAALLATLDRGVSWPREWSRWRPDTIALDRLPLGRELTQAVDGEPAPNDSRLAFKMRILIATASECGLDISAPKTQCGDIIVLLGLLLLMRLQRIRCPEGKRLIMLEQLRTLRVTVCSASPIVLDDIERLVGRLCNISQAEPSIRPMLNGGYAVVRAKYSASAGKRRRAPSSVTLRPGGRRAAELLELIDVAEEALVANIGVPLAPTAFFRSAADAGTVTVVTDASGPDGVGGYGFSPSRPGEVWLVAEPWPHEVAAALAHGAATAEVRAATPFREALSMPAAEIFGCWAIPEAMRDHSRCDHLRQDCAPVGFEAVIAVGDCQPAACALNRACSGAPQIRALVRAARAATTEWLGAQVNREFNLDADLLSHPEHLYLITDQCERAGLRAHVATIPDRCWEQLATTLRLPMGRDVWLNTDAR